MSPYRKPVRDIHVSCFGLSKVGELQLDMFDDLERKEAVVTAQDTINERWGSFVVAPARMALSEQRVLDRIAFGGVKELEEFTKLSTAESEKTRA